MAKTEKPAASTGKPATDKSSTDRSSAAGASTGKASGRMGMVGLFIVAALAAVAVAGGVFYVRGGFDQIDAGGPKKDPDLTELMAPGPLPEMVLGNQDAPNTVIEYASMTCPHCGRFELSVYPDVKAKYIDTGKVRIIFREFPLDGIAARASMLIRCAGPDRYFPMIEALFQTQATWAIAGPEAADRLLQIARQAGFSKVRFDQCMADKDLFQKIVDVRQRAHDKFGVDSTPTFFVNGKRLTGEHELKDFDAALSGKPDEGATKPEGGASPAGGSASPPEGGASPAEGSASPPEGGASPPAGTPGQ